MTDNQPYGIRLWHWLRANVKTHMIATLLVVLATMLAFIYYWNNVRNNVRKDEYNAYDHQVRVLSSATEAHLQLYESFLSGGAGLFSVSSSLSQASWAQYYQLYDISHQFPDIEGIGFSRYLTSDEVPDYLATMQASDPNFNITPSYARNVYVPVTYLAMYTGNTGKSVGYDGFTNPTRRAAMLAAASSGQPAMSGKISLISASQQDRPAFIIYLPVYQMGQPTQTASERMANIYGFVYAAVDIKSMVNILISADSNPNFGLQWYDVSLGSKSQPVYQSSNFANIIKQQGAIKQTLPFTLYTHQWKVVLAASPGIISSNERELPSLVLWRGAFVAFVLGGAVWLLTTARERNLNRLKQAEVQAAKDDLLSLASHQLRTPATIVKQYVGMMLQGYAGSITRKQRGMLQNAYSSNERQLEIINQLLDVARLDAGRIVLHKEKINVGQLLVNVSNEQKTEAQQRRQRLSTTIPKRPLMLNADPRYFRMVLENLINNAIKYTPARGKITLKVGKSGGDIVISVSDTGVGLNESERESIFDKFSRAENGLPSDVDGSGIGLYLVKQIVNLHGGHVEVESQPGHGATFSVYMPTKPKPESAA